MNEQRIAISAKRISKIYKLYDKPSDRMREALGLTRKKRHKEHYALRGVDMTVYQGETVGIIGANGSGKSTLLKIITGVLNPSAGELEVQGRISALLELGAGFNMEYNGIENIYLNGTMMGFSEKEIGERLPDILDFADIGDYVHQPCKTYSSGMFVRLAFAVAINIEPEILIVDEALSVGDVFFQAKCYHKFDEFKKQGKTILFVSHDLSSIAKYCDRVALLNRGAKLGEGSPREMIDDYKRVLVGQYELPEDREDLFTEAELAGLTTGKPAGPEGREVACGSGVSSGGGGGPIPGLNERALEYGTKAGEIREMYLTDAKGMRTSSIIKGEEFSLRMSVRFHSRVPAPIFAFTIKNKQGTELCGTNTMLEKAFLAPVEAGEEKRVTFTQALNLQGGEYLISLGVTGYEGDVFQVYHRLYDALSLTVVSDKDTVGYYDMGSRVTVE